VTVEVNEVELQLILMGLALTVIHRPAWDAPCRAMAKKLQSEESFNDQLRLNSVAPWAAD